MTTALDVPLGRLSAFQTAVENGFIASPLARSHESSSSELLELPSSIESHKTPTLPTTTRTSSRTLSSLRSFDSYDLKGEVGRGAFGIVREAIDTFTGDLRCCKSISKEKLTEQMQSEIRLEADIMMHLKGHPNIVEILDFFEDDTHMHIVQEMCAGGDLYSKLLDAPIPLPDQQATEIMQGVLTVLEHCHSNGVIYRDVKPDNFLLTTKGPDARLKATDFGISKFLKPDELLDTYCGTPLYMAPEVFDMSYGFQADVWAAGVMLYWLMCREFPFSGKNTYELARSVCQKQPIMSGMVWDKVSEDAKDLIQLMLQKSPDKRPTATQLLQHKWFQPPVLEVTPPPLLRKKSSLSLMAKSFVKAMREQAAGSYGGRWEMNSPLAHIGNTVNIRKLERERNWGEARFNGNQVHWRDAKIWAEVQFKTKWSPSPFVREVSGDVSPDLSFLKTYNSGYDAALRRTQGSAELRRSQGSGELRKMPSVTPPYLTPVVEGQFSPTPSGRVSQAASKLVTPAATPDQRLTVGPSSQGGAGSRGAGPSLLAKSRSHSDLSRSLSQTPTSSSSSSKSFFKKLSSKLEKVLSSRLSSGGKDKDKEGRPNSVPQSPSLQAPQ